jgi:hypothetical protein
MLAAGNTNSAAAAASVTYELPEIKKAAAVCCSDWSGGTSTAFIRLNEIVDPELVGSAA